MNVDARLAELGIELPQAPPPAANYRPWVRAGDLLYVSGQLPFVDGEIAYRGHVGADLSEDEGYAAARTCVINALAVVREALGGFDRLVEVVRVEGHVSSAAGWTGQPRVINGASDLLSEALGEKAGHARTALGHNELPLGAAVELALILHVRD